MGFFKTLRISGSGLQAQRMRMDVIANNIANSETTRAPRGGPYKRQLVVFTPARRGASRRPSPLLPSSAGVLGRLLSPLGTGVRVQQVIEDPRAGPRIYAPEHPDADDEGYVSYPNVDIVNELIDLMSARRSYEANVTAMNAAKSMALKALEIGR